MWRRVDIVWTDVSEERIAYIFTVEKSASKEAAWAGGCSDTLLRNVGWHNIYTAPHPRRRKSSNIDEANVLHCDETGRNNDLNARMSTKFRAELINLLSCCLGFK
jgi:hypothetical protein